MDRDFESWRPFTEMQEEDDIFMIDHTNRALLTSTTASQASSRPLTPLSDDDDDYIPSSAQSSRPSPLTASNFPVFKTEFDPCAAKNKKLKFVATNTDERKRWTNNQRGYAAKAPCPKDWVALRAHVSDDILFLCSMLT